MYLVVEWTTMSAPRVSGCCRNGLAKVLSTTSSAPAACAISATFAMSVIFIIGLDGVSTHTNFALFFSMAAARAASSPMSTGVLPMPHAPRTRSIRRKVPP